MAGIPAHLITLTAVLDGAGDGVCRLHEAFRLVLPYPGQPVLHLKGVLYGKGESGPPLGALPRMSFADTRLAIPAAPAIDRGTSLIASRRFIADLFVPWLLPMNYTEINNIITFIMLV